MALNHVSLLRGALIVLFDTKIEISSKLLY